MSLILHTHCSTCGEICDTQNYVYKGVEYCSEKCMDIAILTKCKRGLISFLDIPKEVRDREAKRKHLKCHSRECEVCGATFYVNYNYDGRNKKYCGEQCRKIAERRTIEKNWWRSYGWMSPNWKGGISHGIYCHKFNANLRKRVRAFFGNKCFLCGKDQKDNRKRLAVHHVDYNKNACCDSSRVLMVPLCETCHGKTNFNREQWEEYFKKVLKEKYDYKCYFTKAEYAEYREINAVQT